MGRHKLIRHLTKPQRHSKRRGEKELKRKLAQHRTNNSRKGPPGNQRVQSSENYPVKRINHAHVVTAPPDFSIIKNAKGMLSFFDALRKLARQGRKIYLDLAGVERLTLDSVVYMLWLFEYMDAKYPHHSIQGNTPKNEEVRKLLLDSNFLSYVDSRYKPTTQHEDTLSVQCHRLVQPEVARDVITFARKHLGIEKSKHTRNLYDTLLELMQNSREHAYDVNAPHQKWYLAAHHNNTDGTVTFSFLDGGQGIPRTINTKFREKLKSLLGSRLSNAPEGLKIEDRELVLSALRGEFRTRTQKVYRGKGLPRIFSYASNGTIANLVIVSNHAFLDVGAGKDSELESQFRGTLFSWDFTTQKGAA